MYRLFIDSDNGVDVYPMPNFKEKDKKVENRIRVKSGREYVYKFGDYQQFKMEVTYVTSSFKAVVNSWWNSNAELLFKVTSETQVYSVHLVNGDKPIDHYMHPYTDQFGGTIELSTY